MITFASTSARISDTQATFRAVIGTVLFDANKSDYAIVRMNGNSTGFVVIHMQTKAKFVL